MTSKQNASLTYAPDNSKYCCIVDGAGNLVTTTTSSTGSTKQTVGAQAPDGSIYITLTDGAGSLV